MTTPGSGRPQPLAGDLADETRSGGSTPESPRSGPRSAETRDAILTAARDCFVEQGIVATRLASVARAAYVAPSTVSLHFGNKEGLFAACVDRDVVELLRNARQILHGHPYPALSGDLLRVLVATIDQFPLLATILVEAPGRWAARFYSSQSIEREYAMFTLEVKSAQDAGLVRADVDPGFLGKAIAKTIFSALWSLLLQHDDRTIPIDTSFAIMAAALFYPVNRAQAVLVESAPWRAAHQHVGINFGTAPIPNRIQAQAQSG